MLEINWFALGAFLTFLTSSSIAFIFLRYGYEKSHKLYALFNSPIALWALVVTLATTTQNPTLAYQYWLISHSFGTFVSVIYIHFVSTFCNLRMPLIIFLSYTYGIFMVFMTLVNDGHFLYSGVELRFGEMYYLKAKPLFFILMIPWFFLAIWANFLLYHFNKQQSFERRKEALALFYVGLVGYSGGSSTFLPMTGLNFYPATVFLTAGYSLVMSYYIFKDKLFQFNIFIKTSFIYSLLLTAITTLYIVGIFLMEKLFREQIGYAPSVNSLFIILLLAVIAAPLKNQIQAIADKFFLKGSPIQIAEENQFLRKEVADKEKFKAVATLASGVAHEIKNPISTIKTFFEYLPEKRNDPEFLAKLNRIVGTEISRVDQLVHQLLEFAKPSPLQLQDTQLNDLLMDSLDLLSHEIHKKQIKIITSLGPLSRIQADSNKLKQCFLNIMINAIEAMPSGGELTAKTRLLGREAIEIIIQDTGIGIDPNILPQIFDPFYSKKNKGTGLGLAITKNILEEHSGTIRVESKIGIGTKFIIHLPGTDRP